MEAVEATLSGVAVQLIAAIRTGCGATNATAATAPTRGSIATRTQGATSARSLLRWRAESLINAIR